MSGERLQNPSFPGYTPGIYAAEYVVFVFPFVCLFVRLYLLVCRICVKVLRQSFSSGDYVSATTYQKAFIFGP